MEAEAPTAPPSNERRLEIWRRARGSLAELIGASPEEVSLQQNTTEGINIVVNGLGLGPGDEVITCSLEHPSVVVPFYFTRERHGVRAKMVRFSAADGDAQVVARFEEALTPATKLIMLSHVTYASGRLLPMREICRLAHDRGAYVLVDAAQSVGMMPVSVGELECDFFTFPGHKWLLGPAGTGALYVRRDLIPLLAATRVAQQAAEHYDFEGGFRPETRNIRKFELTTVSVPLLAGLVAAVEFVREIGLEAIRERALHLARYATRGLNRIPGMRLVSPASEEGVASGLVSFSLPDVAPEVMTACLWDRGRVVARTVPEASCTRLSLHVFNTELEVDEAMAIVEDVARRGPPEGDFPSARLEAEAMVEL